jgi:hypothetical protein
LFADPKQSRIDIVQAAGRALRQARGKKYGHILLPLVVPSKMEFSQFAETTAFRQIANTITVMSIQDERIADEFRAIENGRVPSGKIVEIEGDVPVGMKIELGDFADAISTRIWDSVGRANWRSFEEARTFARNLGLRSGKQWTDYCQSGKKPVDIPSSPEHIYADKGWSGWGDWLGTGSVAHTLRQFRSFRDARQFVRGLGLTSGMEWRAYSKGGRRPFDIPTAPNVVYANLGWSGMGDWLGTGRISPGQFRPFKKARSFVRSLGLNSVIEWYDYSRSGKKPADIPAGPQNTYAKTGWNGWGDWLATGAVATQSRRYWSFVRARAFARSLGLKSVAEWQHYLRSGKKPNDIPAKPDLVYASGGWVGWSDWLGNGRVAPGQYRSFSKARAFVRSLGLKSWSDWSRFCKSRKKPDDIPAYPNHVYAHDGWSGIGDWLGTGKVRPGHFRPFNKARAFARGLGLKSGAEWKEYCKSERRPLDIPIKPDSAYATQGWSGMGDWLGYA